MDSIYSLPAAEQAAVKAARIHVRENGVTWRNASEDDRCGVVGDVLAEAAVRELCEVGVQPRVDTTPDGVVLSWVLATVIVALEVRFVDGRTETTCRILSRF